MKTLELSIRWRKTIAVGALLGLFAGSASAQKLDDLILEKKNDWTMSAEEFEKKYMPKAKDEVKKDGKTITIKMGKDSSFEWVSKAKNTARHPGRSYNYDSKKKKWVPKSPTIGKVNVGETLVRFEDGYVSGVEIAVWNKGDNRNLLSKTEFEKMVGDFTGFITKLTKVRAQDRGKDQSSASRASAFFWRGETTAYLLQYSAQRAIRSRNVPYTPEFLKLKLVPSKTVGKFTTSKRTAPVKRSSLRDKVVKKENGDVLIEDVPMVDQGAKGYCAVASAERVMRYYGLDVDQHEMAQIASSSGGGGTSPEKMRDALTRVASKLKVSYKTHADMEYDDFMRLVKTYNRTAKKVGKRELKAQRGFILSFYAFSQFDAETLKTARIKTPAYRRFSEDVHSMIDQGIPCLWSLFLGIFPEKNIPQPSGGHMRLIIGYNDKTNEILYSDSWGAGHELKRMDMGAAFAMTTGLRTLEPQN